MAIAYRSQVTVAKTVSTGTALTYSALPAGTADGDVLVATISTASATVTAPSGWTAGPTIANSTVARVTSFYKPWHTGDPTTESFTLSFAAVAGLVIAAFSGVDNTTPLDVTSVTTTATGTSLLGPSITPVTSGAYIAYGIATNSTSATPGVTSYTLVADVGGESGAMSYFAWTSGSTNDTWTSVGKSVLAAMYGMALRPAPPAVPGLGYAYVL